jgi:hypothetical protein
MDVLETNNMKHNIEPNIEPNLETNNMETNLDLTYLYNKYKNNPYILNRLQIYINNLPNLLENENKKHIERMLRINELTIEQEQFYKIFLSKYKYYYMHYNNSYYLYDNKNYKTVTEDEILYNLLSSITDEGKLIVWKHKTKQTLIKKIKERNLLQSTPETYTIQNILNLFNSFFATKTETKYFLTIIGDCILKKNSKELFFIDNNAKKIIQSIDTFSYLTTGNSISNKFISKYHENHDLTNYRLIYTNEQFMITELNKELFDKIGLDLLCVACHYSERYKNSDNYLFSKVENNILHKILYFSKNNIDNIIDLFISESLEETNINYRLSWKNIHYIWKLFLTNKTIPNMIYSSNLKNKLMDKLPYIEEKNDIIFTNLTSKYLPIISNFLTFWDKHITIQTNNNTNDIQLQFQFQFENNYECLFEYEIDELLTLYKNYMNINNQPYISIYEKDIIKIIMHFFYPNVKIIENKYVTNVVCNLWRKFDNVKNILDKIMEQTNKNQLISFDELYEQYKIIIQKEIITNNNYLLVVSKFYFQKCIEIFWFDYIKFDNFISF